MTLKLSDLEAPLDDVEFPNGSKHVPHPFGPTEYKLWREIQAEADATQRGLKLLAIVTACYPDATADDIDSCTPKMLIAMAAHAGRKIDQIRDALKNVVAVEAQEAPPPPPPATTAPSSPKMNGNTSSRSTRKRSAKTRGESTTVSPTDDQNSSGTGSIAWTSPTGSTISGSNSNTSTVPC